jgi:lipopolysaccharide export LptBFGC system permease protein LptF
MWKLHRYYLKEIGVNAVLTFTVLFGIALVSLLYKGLGLVRSGDLIDAALTTVLLAADIFPHLLMFALLFASVLTFSRASQEREITAIRALGISPRVPMVAALLLGLVGSFVGTWALHYEIPWAHYHKYRVVADIYKSEIKALLDDQDRIERDDFIMTWQRKRQASSSSTVYEDVTIYTRSRAFTRKLGSSIGDSALLVVADRVWFEIEDFSEDITITLENVFVPATAITTASLAVRENLRNLAESRTRDAGEKDLRSDYLLSEVYRGVHERPVAARYTVHRRACFALIPFLLGPIGFCIGVLSRDRGRMLALSFCMVPLGVIYLTDFLGESALRYLQWPLLGWLPAVAMLLGGVPFCWRLLRL